MEVYGIAVILVLMRFLYGIIQPCGMWSFILLANARYSVKEDPSRYWGTVFLHGITVCVLKLSNALVNIWKTLLRLNGK